jgi:hypothetical protein
MTLYIVESWNADRSKVYYYGPFPNHEAARRWAEPYHGTAKRYRIHTMERA